MAIGKMGSKRIFRDPYLRVSRRGAKPRIPTIARPYKYKTKVTARLDADFVTPTAAAAEILTGFVRGKQASDLEERFAGALNDAGLSYVFQYRVDSALSLPGEGQVIDFIVYDGGTPYPVETGSAFVHGSQSQLNIDKARDQILNEILRFRGFQEIIRLPLDRPEDRDDARRLVEEFFG